jgi:radical SAM family protein
MKKAGCIEISFGVESCSKLIQKNIKKNIKIDKIKEAFRLTKEIGIKNILMLMVGNPGESEDTIRETLTVARYLFPDEVYAWPTKAYLGTKLHEDMVKMKKINNDFYKNDKRDALYYTAEKNESEIKKLLKLIGLRKIYLDIGNKKFTELIKIIAMSSLRGKYLILTGSDIFKRKDIEELIKHSLQLDVYKIALKSDIYTKVSKQALSKIIPLRVKKYMFSIYGADSFEHDAHLKKKGAFLYLMEVIKYLISQREKVSIEIYLDLIKPQKLLVILNILCQLKVTEIVFNYSYSYNKYRLKDVSKKLNEIKYDKLTQNIKIFGMPYCLIERKEKISEIYNPFDESYKAPGFSSISALNSANKDCYLKKNCKYRNLCEGIDKKYLKKYKLSKNDKGIF